MYKTCNTCAIEKLITEFRRDRTQPDGFQHRCKICARIAHQDRYVLKDRERTRERNRLRRNTHRTKIQEYKQANPCVSCLEPEPCCLEFHHLNPAEKDFELCRAGNESWETIEREIAKCVVLCSNCHKKIHMGLISIIAA